MLEQCQPKVIMITVQPLSANSSGVESNESQNYG